MILALLLGCPPTPTIAEEPSRCWTRADTWHDPACPCVDVAVRQTAAGQWITLCRPDQRAEITTTGTGTIAVVCRCEEAR